MKTLLLTCAAVMGLTGAAQAVPLAPANTYDVFVTANPFRQPGTPGLQTRAVTLSPSGPQNFNGANYGVQLTNIGDSVSMSLYGLVSYDTPINDDDLLARPTSATFDFGAFGTRTITGQSYAKSFGPTPSTAGYGLAEFFGQTARFKVNNTTQLIVTLADTVFASTNQGLDFLDGREGIGIVQANFSLAAVPLPATLPLGMAALGALGYAGRRKSKKAAQTA